jgi:hypothetical protein
VKDLSCALTLARGYLPQADRAAETIASFSAFVIRPCFTKLSALLAMHETYWPWFFRATVVPRGPAHGQSWAIAQPVLGSTTLSTGVSPQTSASFPTLSPSISASQASPVRAR